VAFASQEGVAREARQGGTRRGGEDRHGRSSFRPGARTRSVVRDDQLARAPRAAKRIRDTADATAVRRWPNFGGDHKPYLLVQQPPLRCAATHRSWRSSGALPTEPFTRSTE